MGRFAYLLSSAGRFKKVSWLDAIPVNDNQHAPFRTRTSPESSWFLNERAAVLGRIGKSQDRADPFAHKAERSRGLQRAALLEVEERTRTLEALDASIALADIHKAERMWLMLGARIESVRRTGALPSPCE